MNEVFAFVFGRFNAPQVRSGVNDWVLHVFRGCGQFSPSDSLKRDMSAAEVDCGKELILTCDSEVSADFKTFILSVCTDDLLVHSGIQSCFQHEAARTKTDFKLTLEQQTNRAGSLFILFHFLAFILKRAMLLWLHCVFFKFSLSGF